MLYYLGRAAAEYWLGEVSAVITLLKNMTSCLGIHVCSGLSYLI